MKHHSPFAVTSLIATVGIAACSGTPPTAGSYQRSPQSPYQVQYIRGDVGFSVQPSQIRHIRGPGFYKRDAKRAVTLYVSDAQNNDIVLFSTYTKNPVQVGEITQGINFPVNIAIDRSGTLYVANAFGNTVTEYPLGSTSPSITLSSQIVNTNIVAVDSKGTAYVTSGQSVGEYSVLEFKRGKLKPGIQVSGFDNPVGLAIDASDNLYVGDAGANKVYKVAKGTTTPMDLQLSNLDDPTGLAFDKKGNLWVSNDAPQYQGSLNLFTITGYKLGQTTPFATIENTCSEFTGCAGLDGPYAIGIDARNTLYAGNSYHYPGHMTSYKKPFRRQHLFQTFSGGIGVPGGIALEPPAWP
jgi:sugar lactone lactonase YvrE